MYKPLVIFIRNARGNYNNLKSIIKKNKTLNCLIYKWLGPVGSIEGRENQSNMF